jgi:NAD(P)-dependent dehydrogenase (short-subunit alcohol dehydrogenase family)
VPVALVTGANTGIGWAIAQRLQRDGFAIVFHTRDDKDASRSRFEEIARGGPAVWIRADLGELDTGEPMVSEAFEALGGLDALVNNAGTTVRKPALELGAEDFDEIFAVDVKAAFLLSVAAAKRMRHAGGGVIVNITSVHEHVPRPGFALYASAKAALGMVTRSLALELAEHGIRVNAVAPGAIATERNREPDALVERIPFRRMGHPDEVAAVVSFLVSDDASYVTGASYLVDGGFVQRVMA